MITLLPSLLIAVKNFHFINNDNQRKPITLSHRYNLLRYKMNIHMFTPMDCKFSSAVKITQPRYEEVYIAPKDHSLYSSQTPQII